MLPIDFGRLADAVNADPEFRLVSRYLDTHLQIEIGDARHEIDIQGGELRGVRAPDFESLNAYPSTILISAPEADWERFLEAVPRPFYQDLWAAQTHHGFEVTGDRATYHAYYRATARLLEVLREMVNDTTAEAS